MSEEKTTNETQPEDSVQPATESEQEQTANDAAFAAGEATAGEALDGIKAERDEAKEKWLRAEAEMENVRRRAKTEIEDLRRYSSLPVIRDVLGPIDNLRLALNAAETTGKVDELVKGIQMVLSQFDSIFSNHYAKPIEAEGVPFDPNVHEALQQIPSADHEPMTVMQEFQRGYKMHERVIRPAKVVVSCAPPEPVAESDENSDEETSS
ncbi:MAG: nucleotide exchange factor GrpE [Planctomycetaceae bacterium]